MSRSCRPSTGKTFELSYRAWKRGWVIHYEPKSIVYLDATSDPRQSTRGLRLERMNTRNRFIFLAKTCIIKVVLVGKSFEAHARAAVGPCRSHRLAALGFAGIEWWIDIDQTEGVLGQAWQHVRIVGLDD